jgi:hypothetical protein
MMVVWVFTTWRIIVCSSIAEEYAASFSGGTKFHTVASGDNSEVKYGFIVHFLPTP